MRFNTRSKRLNYRKEMIFQMKRQGYIYNNSAEDVVDRWIERGSKSFPADGVVFEALRIAKLNVVYDKKNK